MRRTTVLLCLFLMTTNAARAASERRIRTLNIGVQGIMTLLNGLVQGKVHGGRDAARCLLAGSAAGYGSFEAKIMVRSGAVQSGWLLANVAASLSENAAAGKNPLAQIGYTVGPVRLRVVVPWLDRDADAYSYVDLSAYETAALVRAIHESDGVRFRSGMIAFERRNLFPATDGVGPFSGYTFGVYPGVWRFAGSDVRRHEVIHAIQSLQGDALEPSFGRLTYHPQSTGDRRRLIRFDHLKVGLVNGTVGAALQQQRYQDRWTEIEAYRLAQRRAP
jgi:hypothetical protein